MRGEEVRMRGEEDEAEDERRMRIRGEVDGMEDEDERRMRMIRMREGWKYEEDED